jgi:hypothetical protein
MLPLLMSICVFLLWSEICFDIVTEKCYITKNLTLSFHPITVLMW